MKREILDPLFLTAVITGNMTIVQLCVEMCAEKPTENVTIAKLGGADKNGNAALHLAALCSNQEMIKFLIQKGVDREPRGEFKRTPFQFAIEQNLKLEVCKLLYNDSRDLTTTDEQENAALHLASLHNNNQEIIEYLLAQGADREARGRYQRTPFQEAVLSLF